MKIEKVYSVRFMEYTNCMEDTVSDWDGKSDTWGNSKYLSVGKEPFLVRETDLPIVQKYGNGVRDVHFVGNIAVFDTSDPYVTKDDLKDVPKSKGESAIKSYDPIGLQGTTSAGPSTDGSILGISDIPNDATKYDPAHTFYTQTYYQPDPNITVTTWNNDTSSVD